MLNKFLKFTLLITASIFATLLICLIHSIFYNYNIMFNFTILIPIFVSISAIGIWKIKYKDAFEGFLVFWVILLCSLLVMYIGPFTINRSLSTFIYFYAVENGEINKNNYDKTYLDEFIKRRYDDGEKFGFLDCNNDICRPNIKTRIFYYILSPLGKITTSDKYYKQFKSIQNKKDGK